MKTFSTIFLMLLVASVCYGQSSLEMTKSDVVKMAKEYCQSVDPPQNLGRYREPIPVYVADEKVWIVLFSDKRSIPPPDSDFMIKIDEVLGKPLGFLGGVDKEKYYKYFFPTK